MYGALSFIYEYSENERKVYKASEIAYVISQKQMIEFGVEHETRGLPKGSICSASVDLIQDSEQAISSYVAASPNVILSITATLGNVLILIALSHRNSTLHPPSRLLFRCLATTDLGVGVISQPLFIIHVVSVINKSWKLCFISERLAYITAAVLCGVSVFTLTAISADRLLALSLRMRYRELVTLKRIRLIIAFIWFISFANALLYLLDQRIFLMGCFVVIVTAVAIATICYFKIYLMLRRQKSRVEDHLNHSGPAAASLNVEKYKKTVLSALWVHITLVLCNLPYAVVTTVKTIHGNTAFLFIVEAFAATLVFLNSSLNPVLYCWKMKEVRRLVKQTTANFRCLCKRKDIFPKFFTFRSSQTTT